MPRCSTPMRRCCRCWPARDEAQSQAALRAFELILLREIGVLPELSSVTLTLQPVRADAPLCAAARSRRRAGRGRRAGAARRALGGAAGGAGPRQRRRAARPSAPCRCRRCAARLRTLLHYHLGSPMLRTRQVMADVRKLLDTRSAPADEPPRRPRSRRAARHGARTALSVNVNRVALLRNTRPLDIPNVRAHRHAGAAGRRRRHHRAPAARRAPHPAAGRARAARAAAALAAGRIQHRRQPLPQPDAAGARAAPAAMHAGARRRRAGHLRPRLGPGRRRRAPAPADRRAASAWACASACSWTRCPRRCARRASSAPTASSSTPKATRAPMARRRRPSGWRVTRAPPRPRWPPGWA